MKYRNVGSSGVKVSTIALGGWINYGEGKVPEENARKVVETAYEQGIRFFDLADIYGQGEAEKQMGGLLKKYPRHSYVLSTKVFFPMSEELNDGGLSRKHIMESIHKSLQRLSTEYVDIYFCHRPDPETPVLETARAMDDLIHQGKVLYWGTSEWNDYQLQELHDICERHGLYKPQAEQPQYSMLVRDHVEKDILPLAKRYGTGLTVWSPLGMGMLTGKYDNGIPQGSRFERETWVKERFFTEANIEKVKQLKTIADEMKITRSQLALAWVLRHPEVSCTLIGATRPEQVIDNAKAGDITLSNETIEQIESILVGKQPISR